MESTPQEQEQQDAGGIEGLKQVLIATLEKQGMLNSIKAGVRATVFTALKSEIDSDDSGGFSPSAKQRKTKKTKKTKTERDLKVEHLLSSEEGNRALEYVVDLLKWANLKHTLRVLECELPLHDSTRLQQAFAAESATESALPKLVAKLGSTPVASGLPPLSPTPMDEEAVKTETQAEGESNLNQVQNQMSAASLYSEITEEVEEMLSFVDEGSDNSVVDIDFEDKDKRDDGSSLHPMDSTTLDVVNSTLSASDHSGELDSDADEIETAEF